jgi:iron complex transport system ATP-binding protein
LLGLGRFPHRGRLRETEADRAAIASAMAATDVIAFARRPVTALSGGERDRVLLARVLAGLPEWLLADEPLANLDPGHQLEALACLRAAARAGAGDIVVLHNLNHAPRIADALLLLPEAGSLRKGRPRQC